MKKLIGKHIKNIYIKDEECLSFETPDGDFLTYYTYGDCCSSSWFEHISGIDNLLNHEILEVEEIDLADLNIDNEGEFIQVYGVKIKTSKGYFDIEFRNASNGYYGGYIQESHESIDDIQNGGYKLLTKDF